eukprot:Seg930.3 transcript_id=Seg930.3/GoldUCD/mRNA.D3Y31 product="hypothetical protein" protein_id=Seg930.3/GoldUCD/D3Y31
MTCYPSFARSKQRKRTGEGTLEEESCNLYKFAVNRDRSFQENSKEENKHLQRPSKVVEPEREEIKSKSKWFVRVAAKKQA